MGKNTFSITIAKQSIKLDSKRTTEASFTVTNTSDKPVRGQLKLRPVEARSVIAAQPAWLTLIGDAERTFAPQATVQVTARIAVPESVLPGTYGVRLDAISTSNTDDDLTEGPPMVVEVSAVEPTPKKKFPWWIPVAAGVAVVVIGVGGWFVLSSGKGTVVVPDVVKEALALDQAVTKIKAANLEPDPREQKIEGLPATKEKTIVKTEPAPGDKVAKGTKVALYYQVGSAAPRPPAKPPAASPLDLGLEGIWDMVEVVENGRTENIDDQHKSYAVLARSGNGIKVELHRTMTGQVSEVWNFNVFTDTMTLDSIDHTGRVYFTTRLERASSTDPGRWGVEVWDRANSKLAGKGSARISNDWHRWQGELNVDGGKTLATTMTIAPDGKTWIAALTEGERPYSITFRKR